MMYIKNNKYGNKKTIIDGIVFDSIKEANRYRELKLLQQAGLIDGLLRQVKFELVPKQKDERAVHYIADFVYVEKDKTIIEDVKSEITRKDKSYIIKRKLMKMLYKDTIFREV